MFECLSAGYGEGLKYTFVLANGDRTYCFWSTICDSGDVESVVSVDRGTWWTTRSPPAVGDVDATRKHQLGLPFKVAAAAAPVPAKPFPLLERDLLLSASSSESAGGEVCVIATPDIGSW